MIKERYDLINAIIRKNGYKSYLEIGVQNGQNFRQIKCDRKTGVDPDPQSEATIHKTSDEFFISNVSEFDCIFIDGLHHRDQVLKDIRNSLVYLSYGGTIICHDMKPKSYEQQAVPRISKSWTGDCWKAWMDLRAVMNAYSMQVVDLCTGCGVIKRGNNSKLIIPESELTYENLKNNMNEWLNLISVSDFIAQNDLE